MVEIIGKVMPILLLCLTGVVIRKKQFISENGMNDIKKIVINIALPAVLFITFLTMDYKKEYLLISLMTMVMLMAFYLVGRLANKVPKIHHRLTPYVTTGYSFGLLGIPLYGIVFGLENIGVIAILGFGHEVFVWFIYYSLLKVELHGEKFGVEQLFGFIKSPLIISIILGLSLNLLGAYSYFKTSALLLGVETTIRYFGSIATPLILISIGYGIRLNKKYIKRSLGFVLLRMTIMFVVGYLFKIFIFNKLIEPTMLFNYAFFTFIILPPMFSLPILVGQSDNKEEEILANNTVILNTIISLVVFLAVIIFTIK